MAKILNKIGEKHGFATNSSSYHSVVIRVNSKQNELERIQNNNQK